MELAITTPALLFPAISLLMISYTTRFLHLANLARSLHAINPSAPEPVVLEQINIAQSFIASLALMHEGERSSSPGGVGALSIFGPV